MPLTGLGPARNASCVVHLRDVYAATSGQGLGLYCENRKGFGTHLSAWTRMCHMLLECQHAIHYLSVCLHHTIEHGAVSEARAKAAYQDQDIGVICRDLLAHVVGELEWRLLDGALWG